VSAIGLCSRVTLHPDSSCTRFDTDLDVEKGQRGTASPVASGSDGASLPPPGVTFAIPSLQYGVIYYQSP